MHDSTLNLVAKHGSSVTAFAGALLLLACNALADGMQSIMLGPEATARPGLEWRASATIPPGVMVIMILGNPRESGPYVFRAKFPPGYLLPAHKHPDRRSVTVLQGSYWSGEGEQFDKERLTRFGPGSFYVTEPGVPHFAWAEDEVIIQEMGMGPIGNPIEYINPAEDPRKR